MPITFPEGLMVSVSGFRGVVGDPLTPELVGGLAAAYGSFLQAEGFGSTILIGRDSRTSGPMLARAAVAGLQSVGCRVVDLGVVPTPTLMLAVEESDAAGGIGITASHNPAEWNAMKFAAAEGTFLDAARMARFQAFVQEQDPDRVSWDELGRLSQDPGAIARHLTRILDMPLLDVDGLRTRSFKVALDCVNGAGAGIMLALLDELGCRVSAMNTDADGRFPRDPEPTAENLRGLGDLVRESGADVGLAVDPDVDRLSLVDEHGSPMGEDLTLALASAVVLRRTPGPVVTNLSTSQVLEDVARSFECDVIRAPVGEINVATRMQREGAVIGGEGNGGVILPAVHLTRDAPLGAALILQHLLDTGESMSSAVAKWPVYAIVKTKISFPREHISDAYKALRDAFSDADFDEEDGLRLAWGQEREWLHVRPSGTEPVVRLIAEAPDRSRAEALVARGQEILGGVL